MAVYKPAVWPWLTIIPAVMILQTLNTEVLAASKNILITYGNMGMNSNDDLPQCMPNQACNIVYPTPINRIEKYCQCPSHQSCSESTDPTDHHTILDKNTDNQVKLCENTSLLQECKESEPTGKDLMRNYHLSVFVFCKCPQNYTHDINDHKIDIMGQHYYYSCIPQVFCASHEACNIISLIRIWFGKWIYVYEGFYRRCVCATRTNHNTCSTDYHHATLFQSEKHRKLAYVYCPS